MPPHVLLPLRLLPKFSKESPEVVRLLDKIRFELDTDDSMAEFCWFAREYPRVYRHHFGHVEHRLKFIYQRYQKAHDHFSAELLKADSNCFSMATFSIETLIVYWDFEAFLNAVSATLDVLARVVGTAFKEQTPPSFNKLCKKHELGGCIGILRTAQNQWVSRMKNYRDCFVHYTCVDTMLTFACNRYSDGFELRCRLPSNPNVRDIMGFRFSRRLDVLRYACSTYKNLLALDRAISRQISKDYQSGVFPKRTSNLFFLGTRMHTETSKKAAADNAEIASELAVGSQQPDGSGSER